MRISLSEQYLSPIVLVAEHFELSEVQYPETQVPILTLSLSLSVAWQSYNSPAAQLYPVGLHSFVHVTSVEEISLH